MEKPMSLWVPQVEELVKQAKAPPHSVTAAPGRSTGGQWRGWASQWRRPGGGEQRSSPTTPWASLLLPFIFLYEIPLKILFEESTHCYNTLEATDLEQINSGD